METELLPDLFNRGLLVADQRIRVLHYHDRGAGWAIANGFWNCRTSYGYLRARMSPQHRRDVLRFVLTRAPRDQFREALAASRGMSRRWLELALVAAINAGAAAGAATGLLAGPGRSPHLTA
jgi:hypothetical protein